ncbi:MAG TPA: hypothetical protein VEY91_04275 [Candidatus Limnocylindria bacterium]|nr:hypothetical protein [Candidatus Limnocylindria bacterium]
MRGALLAALALAFVPVTGRSNAAASAERASTGFEVAIDPPAVPFGSELALPLFAEGEQPEMVFAQRTIEREWMTPTDPNAPRPIPGWRSEPLALGLSAALPGAGQLYAGERSGYLFLLAEVAGWVGLVLLRDDSNDLRAEAAQVAGAPENATSGWSYERWTNQTADDTGELENLYAADREAFYDAIANDPRYQAGWVDPNAQETFRDLRQRSDRQLHRSHSAGRFLWINHLVAAADALRAARFHNLPLRQNVDLKARASWRHGHPELVVAVEGRF